MSDKRNPDQPIIYQINIEGHLDDRWADWFENASISLEENGDTLITCPVVDQAALHGLLKKVRDLGIPLLSVNSIQPAQPTDIDFDQAETPDSQY